NLKIGGDVSFKATGVEAHIKNASVSGAVTPTTLAANDAEGEVINTSMTQADIDTTFANWSDIKLDFDADATDIELKFEIANTSTNADNYIEIDYSYSFSNSIPNVDVFPGDENDQKVWENNNYILTPKGSAEMANYETFTLKFRVLNKELNVPQDTKVDLTISLKHITPEILATTDSTNYYFNDIKYALTTGTLNTASVAGYQNSPTDVVIPAVVSDGTNNFVVTSIGMSAFQSCSSIKSIEFPNSIVTIGNFAFSAGCTIRSFVFPKSVTTIGFMVFQDSLDLISITISECVTSIGISAFSNCTNLATVKIDSQTIASGLTGANAFGELIKYPTSIYIKSGLDVSSATYLTNTSNFTPEKVGDAVADADGDGYILYTKVTA
ncbi:MAG: leucine-rich repeat domain-containing protein, partial [Clostridia bacterium]|nr:leucine-rich repeat domain-containing protein [Clostridia bacterium]